MSYEGEPTPTPRESWGNENAQEFHDQLVKVATDAEGAMTRIEDRIKELPTFDEEAEHAERDALLQVLGDLRNIHEHTPVEMK